MAIAKPAGLLVHRSRIDRWERAFALQRLRDQLECAVYPVHRLDKATSGVLLFALHPGAAARVAEAFESGAVRKRYLAVVRGWPAAEQRIDQPLEAVADRYVPAAATSAAQPALTRVRCLATASVPVAVDRYPTSRYGLVELEPATGRRHQLRRHLKHAGHPIIGDTTYGQGRHNRFFRDAYASHRLLLAATTLCLAHPGDGTPLVISTPPEPDFAAVAAALGWDAGLLQAAARRPFA